MRKQIGIKLDTELLREVDEARGTIPRTTFIEGAIKHLLNLNHQPPIEVPPKTEEPGEEPKTDYKDRWGL